MQHKMLKLSTLAMLIAGATGANAAVYKVVEVTDVSDVESLQYFPTANTSNNAVEFYGQGIKASAPATDSTPAANCFDATSTTCTPDDYTVVGESRRGTDGINYRDSIAFLTDNYQHLNDRYEFERYCNDNLGFNTCDVWSEGQYYGNAYNRDQPNDRTGLGGLQREQAAWYLEYFSNASPIVDGESLSTFANSADGYSDADKAALGTMIDSGSHVTPNSVVNGIVAEAGTDYVYGITSSAYFSKDGRNARAFDKRGFVNAGANKTELTPPAVSTDRPDDKLAEQMGQTLANDAVIYDDKLLVVGSASYAPSFYYNRGTSTNPAWEYDEDKLPDIGDIKGDDLDISNFDNDRFKSCVTNTSPSNVYSQFECQFSTFANQAAFWTVDSSGLATPGIVTAPDEEVLDPDNRDRSFQASAKAVAVVDAKPIITGFSTKYRDDDYYAVRAAVFTPKDGNVTDNNWSMKFIPGTEVENNDGDRQFSYSTGTDINDNNKVIGIAKNFRAENRSYAQKMFVFDNVAGTTKFLDTSIDSTIFFDGSNGYTAAINNHDVVVGWVDSETVNQVDGRERRQRAFLFNDGAAIANSPLSANGTWMLDNLTNDNGDKSAVANQFRIAQATGINDAGVISATALRCAGGYDNLTSESQCSGGERLVAVKLVPIVDGTIQARPEESGTIKRSGASFGMFALTLLGLFGFRRRK
ncbi:MAG: DUF3466 family protein [Photobacterium frigidiphilum]|uniref:DUF3466 family protein n=1 Tax=Photobacterium frigidiphilum TaxID=264736 RepID=UPI00300219C5